jgi:hypothetical protein
MTPKAELAMRDVGRRAGLELLWAFRFKACPGLGVCVYARVGTRTMELREA